MNILAIETSTKRASVTVKKDDQIFSKNVENEITHSEKLLPLIDEMINESGLNANQVDLFASTNGPGSFTGIRIGLSTIKGIAHVLNKEIFSVSSLMLLAYKGYLDYVKDSNEENYSSFIFCPIMDAKNSRVYYGAYRFDKIDENNNVKVTIKEVLKPSNDEINTALENIKNSLDGLSTNKTFFVGDSICIYSNHFKGVFKDSEDIFVASEDTQLDSKDLILLLDDISVEDYNKNLFHYHNLFATYARVSQAERLKNE